MKFNIDTLRGPLDACYPARAAEYPQPGILEQIANRQRQFTKPVFEIAI